jgi:DNA-binding CsgD family transcriptional regulator
LRVPDGDDPLPNAAGESWRTWLITGARRGPVDRRRVRGAHVGIKKMLVEGLHTRGDRPYTWKEFSDAMVRQAVGDAMQTLSYRDSQLVKLAYFGGLSNREIAGHMRMTEATVQRRLRHAVDAISSFVERGRGLGSRLLVALAVWFSGRTASDAMHAAAQGVVVATAAAIIATHPAAVGVGDRHGPAAPVTQATSAPVTAPVPSPTAPVSTSTSTTTSSSTSPAVPVPSVQVPSVPLPSVQVPALPSPPVTIKKIV